MHWGPYSKLKITDDRDHWQRWLTLKGSMTRAMEGVGDVAIELIHRGKGRLFIDEARYLCLDPRQAVFVREVIMTIQKRPVLFGRTIIPWHLRTGPLNPFFSLGKRAIGKLLFAHPHCTRSDFDFELLKDDMPLAKRIPPLPEVTPPCYTRRSCFHIENHPLLLSEVFFPSFGEMCFR